MTGASATLRFRTLDPGEFVHSLEPFAHDTSADHFLGRGFSAAFRATRLSRLAMFRVKIGDARVRRGARSYLAVTIPLDGSIEFVDGTSPRRFRAGEAHLLRPQTRLDLRVGAPTELIVATIPQDWFASKSLAVLDRNTTGRSRISLETPEGRAFASYARFVWGEVVRGGGIFRSPIAIREVEDMFLTLLLLAADRSGEPPRRRERHVRSAEEYMRGHLREPVTIDDITRAAGVTGRTLLRAFRRHRGTTTVGFLRILRLQAARRDLLAQDAREATVTEIATRYGFYELGRFAGRYRSTFGELPSETLAR